MKKSFQLVFLLISSLSCFSADYPFRVWTSTTGVKIEARLISKTGNKLTIERSDSKQFVFPISLVSKIDQDYVRSVLMSTSLLSNGTSVISTSKQAVVRNDSGTLPIWSPALIDKWWLTNEDANLEELCDQLFLDLRSIWVTKEKRSLREGRDFFSWFDHWRWLTLFNNLAAEKGVGHLKDSFVEVGKNPSLQKTFLTALHPEDHKTRALEIFLSIAKAHPDTIERYSSLAVAYSVVFDQSFPRNWPHHQVLPKYVPIDTSPPAKRFGDMVKAHLARKLEYDPSQLSVTELKFVVDHRLPASELDWARESAKFRRSSFGKTFSSIVYDRPRLDGAVFRWPYGDYSLSSIQEKGGICVDQAYFSSMVGKAKGIPTLTFVGQGSGGGHAWFGFLKNPGRWETDCGRYENQNYPVGNAIDPQLWKLITDDELGALARGEKNLSGFRGKAVDYFA